MKAPRRSADDRPLRLLRTSTRKCARGSLGGAVHLNLCAARGANDTSRESVVRAGDSLPAGEGKMVLADAVRRRRRVAMLPAEGLGALRARVRWRGWPSMAPAKVRCM